ncbi:MAG: sugar phosphate isomerase/epimerase [Clostridia bacterium]|nr:sugar phosphate isomerase/epimerase [Clostridia bacterium]
MSMANAVSRGGRIPVIVPSRYYQSYFMGGKSFGTFSASAMVDFLARQGFDGIDLSLDSIDVYDDSLASVYFGLKNRATANGLAIPVCHLPFYMPNPEDAEAMKKYSASVLRGVDIAGSLGIPDAVIHPVVRHSSRCCHERWIEKNIDFLTPVCHRAREQGVRLAIENMAGVPYKSVAGDKVFGCRAEDIVLLADRLKTGVCWDTGHANITGLCQSAELSVIGGRLTALHIHGNDGKKDAHLLPCNPRSTMDVDDLAKGLRAIGFTDRAGIYLNFEIKTSHLTADRSEREKFAHLTLKSAAWITKKL